MRLQNDNQYRFKDRYSSILFRLAFEKVSRRLCLFKKLNVSKQSNQKSFLENNIQQKLF